MKHVKRKNDNDERNNKTFYNRTVDNFYTHTEIKLPPI